ncbi:hypothetical protein [Nocardioides sp. AE5]|uniref:hypothetical protein n=1 Tax=Nocardioides sp. AE5 TaxID=2962573 RepID=UPI0028810FCA|nr:hypothetical protein [Nocardioides sp. AE5]MDT0202140.1 hypothetical protein [Nocardioides sp. AE5]
MTDPAPGETVLPGVVDHHVHLGLVDRNRLVGSPVVEVHDLGWDPGEAATFRDQPPAGVRVRAAGPFHAAPGGYPSGRAWAPAAAIRAVTDTTDARRAVEALADAGFDRLKITLHTDFPALSGEALAALVHAAHDAGLPVLAHAEGSGNAARAIHAGVDVLVHAPWTESLPDALLAAAAPMTWLSTLAIHAPEAQQVAIDNIVRFRAAGGTVRYGTDMGNGPTPVGVNAAEVLALGRAGLVGEDLIAAVTAGPPVLASPHPRPHTAEELVAWLADARHIPDQAARQPLEES